MNLEPNNKSLSFAEFFDAAIRDKAEAKPFPYTLEVCRCRYCSFCQNGKCALKRCCCMNERVKERSCSFAEPLRDCFANFKDNVFQFRLRIACERATELHTCFLDAGHRARFYEGVSYMRKKDPKFIAQCLDLKLTEPNAYLYFCTAMDIQYGGSHIDLYELTLDEIVDFDAFRVICNSVAMHDLSLMSETHASYVTRQETDANGNVVEVTEEINNVYVTVITTPKSADQIADEYGFTDKQKQMLTELLSSENAELWAGILSE